nr:hypothetical protein [Enterobacter hormaechei]
MIVVNVNPLYTPRELEHQLNDSGAAAIVIVSNFAHTLEKVVERTQVNHDHPCPEDPEQRHRVLQQVWHHQRDAIPFLQAQPFL